MTNYSYSDHYCKYCNFKHTACIKIIITHFRKKFMHNRSCNSCLRHLDKFTIFPIASNRLSIQPNIFLAASRKTTECSDKIVRFERTFLILWMWSLILWETNHYWGTVYALKCAFVQHLVRTQIPCHLYWKLCRENYQKLCK